MHNQHLTLASRLLSIATTTIEVHEQRYDAFANKERFIQPPLLGLARTRRD